MRPRKHPERFDLLLKPEDAVTVRLLSEAMGISFTELIRRGVAMVRADWVRQQSERKQSGRKRAQGGAR